MPADAPLPPLPDGGLAALMPAWLRDAPERDPGDLAAPAAAGNGPGDPAPSSLPPAVPAAASTLAPAPAAPESPSIGDFPPATAPASDASGPARPDPTRMIATPTTFDPVSLITADDLPAWLRALGAPAAGGVSPTSAAAVRPLPPAERVASPLYLPRAQPLPVADAAPPVDRETAAERPMPAGAGAVADLPDAVAGVRSVPSTRESAAVAAGDDGAPPAVAAEANGTPASGSTATETANPATVAAVASADRDAAQADQPLDADPDGLLQDGVAAGIATIAILIVAAVIVFVVWRATTGP